MIKSEHSKAQEEYRQEHFPESLQRDQGEHHCPEDNGEDDVVKASEDGSLLENIKHDVLLIS
jgi:hypothetical protein